MAGTMLEHSPRHAVGTADTPGLRYAAATPRCARGSYCAMPCHRTLERPPAPVCLAPAGCPTWDGTGFLAG